MDHVLETSAIHCSIQLVHIGVEVDGPFNDEHYRQHDAKLALLFQGQHQASSRSFRFFPELRCVDLWTSVRLLNPPPVFGTRESLRVPRWSRVDQVEFFAASA